jgi:hypothetical protein
MEPDSKQAEDDSVGNISVGACSVISVGACSVISVGGCSVISNGGLKGLPVKYKTIQIQAAVALTINNIRAAILKIFSPDFFVCGGGCRFGVIFILLPINRFGRRYEYRDDLSYSKWYSDVQLDNEITIISRIFGNIVNSHVPFSPI